MVTKYGADKLQFLDTKHNPILPPCRGDEQRDSKKKQQEQKRKHTWETRWWVLFLYPLLFVSVTTFDNLRHSLRPTLLDEARVFVASFPYLATAVASRPSAFVVCRFGLQWYEHSSEKMSILQKEQQEDKQGCSQKKQQEKGNIPQTCWLIVVFCHLLSTPSALHTVPVCYQSLSALCYCGRSLLKIGAATASSTSFYCQKMRLFSCHGYWLYIIAENSIVFFVIWRQDSTTFGMFNAIYVLKKSLLAWLLAIFGTTTVPISTTYWHFMVNDLGYQDLEFWIRKDQRRLNFNFNRLLTLKTRCTSNYQFSWFWIAKKINQTDLLSTWTKLQTLQVLKNN